MISIDGSEAGGQILRTSLALSSVTKKPFKMDNIRATRPKSGLKAQHLKALEAITKITDADVTGGSMGSKEISFSPKNIKGGRYSIDVGTAGSISLVLQTMIPACLHADKETELEVTGGTVGLWAPSIVYFQQIYCNFLEVLGMKRGEDFDLKILRHGFYPKGGGKVVFRIRPFQKLKEIDLAERGRFKRYDIWSIASKPLENADVAERQIQGAEQVLGKIEKKNPVYADTLSTGTLVHIHAHYENTKLGADILGERGKKAEDVGKECAELLKEQIDCGACLDTWMADQILILMALSGGGKVSVAKITNHILTNIDVIGKFLDVKFKVEGKKGEPGIITLS